MENSMIPYQDAEALLAEAGLSFQDFVLLTGASYSQTFSLASVQKWISEPLFRASTEISVRMQTWEDVENYMIQEGISLDESETDYSDVASVLGYYVSEKGEVEFRSLKNAPDKNAYPYFVAFSVGDEVSLDDLVRSARDIVKEFGEFMEPNAELTAIRSEIIKAIETETEKKICATFDFGFSEAIYVEKTLESEIASLRKIIENSKQPKRTREAKSKLNAILPVYEALAKGTDKWLFGMRSKLEDGK